MKKLTIIILSLIAFSAMTIAQTNAPEPKKDGTEILRIKTSAVCDMCKETIEKAMAYEKGIKKADLNVDTKVLTVMYDAKKTTPDKIRKAVALSGYDADEMPADQRAYDNLHACCKKDVKH